MNAGGDRGVRLSGGAGDEGRGLGTRACWKRHRGGTALQTKGARAWSGVRSVSVSGQLVGDRVGPVGARPGEGTRDPQPARPRAAARPHLAAPLLSPLLPPAGVGFWGSQRGGRVGPPSPRALWTPRVGRRFCAGCWVAPRAQSSPRVTPELSQTLSRPLGRNTTAPDRASLPGCDLGVPPVTPARPGASPPATRGTIQAMRTQVFYRPQVAGVANPGGV